MTSQAPAPDAVRPMSIFVLDCEALSLAVRGDRTMYARFEAHTRGKATILTSPLTLVEAYEGKVAEQRWNWALSRIGVAELGKEEARQARRTLSEAGLHGHKYAIDAMLAVVAKQQMAKGEVTVFTSDVDDLERLLPDSILVMKV